MKAKTIVSSVTQGRRADIGDYQINRILPGRYLDAVGPFVFLDHLLPSLHSVEAGEQKPDGTGAHPHRGIATLTYVLNGRAEHYDSKGNHSIISSGGVQWMKAGNGIIHDESLNVDPDAGNLLTHSFQFWINLPSAIKAEEGAYLPVQPQDVPEVALPELSGSVKVIAGEFQGILSPIPSFSKQFIYHLHLEPDKLFFMETESHLEYAAFLPLASGIINDKVYQQGDLLTFAQASAEIVIENTANHVLDVILFGGEPYTEPIVAHGPFVMNTREEISVAYNDYHQGKYGKIRYED